MSTPTVPVTVDLAAMGGPALAGITVRATLDGNEVYTGIVVAKRVEAVTNANGVAILNLFPNAPAPTGLGTQGTTYRFTATVPGGRGLNVDARVPNTACRLENILVLDEIGPVSASELALLQAQAAVPIATAQAAAAAASAAAAHADATQTAADRVQTGLDRAATAADRAQTGADRVQTGSDRIAASSSASAAAGSEAQAAAIVLGAAAPWQLTNYTALRAYSGGAKTIEVTGYSVSAAPSGIAGLFTVDDSDTTNADNGGTIIVASNGKRWKRLFDGKLRPEYFGADGNVTTSYDPAVADGTPSGSDSSSAFRAMMAYAQSLSRAVIALRPGAIYYVTGDNPCGVQTSVVASCVINIEGNNARIYWRPTLTTDSLFGKLGLLYNPQWSDFRVWTLGAPGDRRGIVFNTKMGFANVHYFSQAHFDKIMVNSGETIGCDIVFNFEADGTHSHDDLSVYEGISAVCYNKFVRIKNGEAVANVFRRCITAPYTNGAVTFDVDTSAAFSGYLDIDRHAHTFKNAGETFLKTKDENVLYPIYVRSPRWEKQATVAYKLFDLGSCRVVVSGLSSAPGSSSSYFDNTNQYMRIGQFASLVLEDCSGLDGNIQIDAGQQGRSALVTHRSSFYRYFAGARGLQPFPKIKWGTYASRTAALAAGAQFNYVSINEPDPANNMSFPISFSRRMAHDTRSVIISNLLVSGKSTLNGTNTIPEDTLFESLFLKVEAFGTTSVDRLDVLVTNSVGGFIKTYTVNFAGTAVSQELITAGKVLTIPLEGAISYVWYKSGVVVSDSTLFPEARIKATYRESISSRECNAGAGGEINEI